MIKELKADANALMNLEMMDAVVGGASAKECEKSCTSQCTLACKVACVNHCVTSQENSTLPPTDGPTNN